MEEAGEDAGEEGKEEGKEGVVALEEGGKEGKEGAALEEEAGRGNYHSLPRSNTSRPRCSMTPGKHRHSSMPPKSYSRCSRTSTRYTNYNLCRCDIWAPRSPVGLASRQGNNPNESSSTCYTTSPPRPEDSRAPEARCTAPGAGAGSTARPWAWGRQEPWTG